MDAIDFSKLISCPSGMIEKLCSESQLNHLAQNLAAQIQLGDRILLQGSMGVGKTTFSRALLQALGIEQPSEGSPTFAIAHEYDSKQGRVVHLDFYRLRSEAEIEDAGILAYYWEYKRIVISEWLDSWPLLEQQVIASGRSWIVCLNYSETQPECRHVHISFLHHP